MIERKVMSDKFLQYSVNNFVKEELGDVVFDRVEIEKTPMGVKVIIYTSTPGLIIGRDGSNIKKLTKALKEKFNFDNPQVKIGDVENPYLSASIVAKMIVNDLSRFGSQKFKLSGFKALTNIINSGAMGAEIRISGKLPSSRAKSWRFAKGYLKKTGYASDFYVDKAIESVTLKTGVVGIKVMIMKADTPLPDKIEYIENVKVEDSEEVRIKEKKEDLKKEKNNKEIESEEVKE
jgi:small subunit ribosomal protein S3